MEREVIFRPDQHVKQADFENLQDFTRTAIDHVVADGINAGKKYKGLDATKTGPTETTVNIGRLYSSGQVFVRDVQTVHSHIAKLPTVQQRIATIVVWGLEVEENIEPRAFVIDANANPPVFEPREVTMRSTRAIQMDVIYGVESAAPARGIIDSSVVAVADILLSNTGVVSVTMDESNALVSVDETQGELDDLSTWRGLVGQQIDTLRSDLARIAKTIPADPAPALAAIALAIQDIWNYLHRPAAAFASFVDRFRNTSDTDEAHAGYTALVEDGLTFGGVAPTQTGISLLNPLEPKVTTVDSITLPAWVEVPRLSIRVFGTYVIITSHPVVTINHCKHHMTRKHVHYGKRPHSPIGRKKGPAITDLCAQAVCDDPSSDAGVAEIKRRPDLKYLTCKRVDGEPHTVDWPRFWKRADLHKLHHAHFKRCHHHHYDEPCWPAVITTGTISGCAIAQTFLNPNNGWMTSVRLFFRDKAGAGDVKVLLCKVVDGIPDETQVIASGDLVFANIHTRTEGVRVPITPTYLESGERYALVISSPGAHSFWLAIDNKRSFGSHFHRGDTNVWICVGQGDVCIEINMAQFSSTRAEVQMNPAQLVGGISELHVLAAAYAPPGTSLTWEVQNAGTWMPLAEGDDDALTGNPALVPLRAVFIGTHDLMPGIDLSQAELEVSRTNLTFTHFSEDRDYGSATTDIRVVYDVTEWDADHHTLDCRLIIGGVTSGAAGTITTVPDPEDPTHVRITFAHTVTSTSTIDSIKTIGTTASDTDGFFNIVDRWDHAY